MTKEQIINKIKETTSLSDEDIELKIKAKLDQLAGLVSDDGAAHIVANELGVQLVPSTEETIEIKHLLEGMRNVQLKAKLTRKFDVKEFNSARGPGKLASFIIGDNSGTIRVTLWNTKVDDYFDKINEGDMLEIKGAYVKKNNYTGNLDINMGDGSEIIINPEGLNIEIDNSPKKKKISDLEDNNNFVEILATIVQVSDMRFWGVCPECNKKPKFENDTYTCQEHGEIPENKLDYSYVMNCYLDDGSASIRCVFWKQQIQELLEKPHEEILKYRESLELFEHFKSDLLGEIIKVRGRVNKNEAFDRVEFVVNSIDKNPDPEEESKNIPEQKNKTEEIVKSKTEEKAKVEETTKNSESDIPSLDDIEEINIDDE